VPRILVVEDEPAIALPLKGDLELEGYDVEVAADGESAVARAREGPFDLILLDVMLPRKDGFEVCRELRRGGVRTPIILLTARTEEAEKVLGLELGADDYVTKPFSPRELVARVKAVLRRTLPGETVGPTRFSFGGLSVDASEVHGTACAEIVHDVAPGAELYLANAGTAVEVGITLEDVQSTLVAVAPIIGGPRSVQAAGNIARALGFAIAAVEAELDAELDDDGA